MGTLTEFTITRDEHRPVGALKASIGTSDYLKTIVEKSEKEGPGVVYDANLLSIVGRLLGALKKGGSRRPAQPRA